MASLTQVPWSKGRYDSYALHSDGSLIGTINHPGYAWIVTDNNVNHPTDMTFLSSRNQLCRGSWFIAALLPTKFNTMKTGVVFRSQLVLVMGTQVTAKSLLQRNVLIYYYKIRPNLSVGTITDLFESSPTKTTFISTLFEPLLTVGSESTTHLRYLNQIAGPTLLSWNILPSIATVDGVSYHQCREGPDSWYDRPHFNKVTESCVDLTKPSFSTWRPDKQHYISTSNTPYCKKIIQLHSSKVLHTYTERMPSFGRFMWMPLPDTQSLVSEFALITIDQKLEIDSLFTEAQCLMDPKEFRDLLLDMTMTNGLSTFVQLTKLSCGSSYFGQKCMMFIVSIVSKTEMATLKTNDSTYTTSCYPNKVFKLVDNNTSDCDLSGTVVFRGYKFRTDCKFGKEDIALVMAAYRISYFIPEIQNK